MHAALCWSSSTAVPGSQAIACTNLGGQIGITIQDHDREARTLTYISRLLDLAKDEDAIIVAPDHRLLPESHFADIYEDCMAFWDWYKEVLPVLAEKWPVQPNPNRILTVGQSSGAMLALQSAILRPDITFNAIITLHGPLFDDIPYFNIPSPKHLFGLRSPPPRQAELVIRNYVRRTKGTVRTTGEPSEYGELMVCLAAQAWGKRRIRQSDATRPVFDTLQMLEGSKGLPPTWFIHAAQDSVVSRDALRARVIPCTRKDRNDNNVSLVAHRLTNRETPQTPTICTTEFVARYIKEVPDAQPYMLSLPEGGHNFETALSINDAPWISEGCDFILDYW